MLIGINMLLYKEFPIILETGEDVIVEIEILYDPPKPYVTDSDWDYYGETKITNVWLTHLDGKPWMGYYDEVHVNKEIDKWLRGCNIERVMQDNQPF